MPKQVSRTARCAREATHRRAVSRVVLRRFDPARDSYDRLTTLLHRAFAPLVAMGFNCKSASQPPDVTQARAQAGECFVAVCDGQVVGTLTLCARKPDSPCTYYRNSDVATIHQFGIDPRWQSRGIGKALLAFAERWAAMHGFARLALDTPHSAAHLVSFYLRRGFRLVDVVRFAGRCYESAVLSKPSIASAPLAEIASDTRPRYALPSTACTA
ncbi:GNAT family N-acetyltransferase [Trinickia fusca]|uniref:GNAT family N-acetyltransferase n=1 Tax=Trinickia fusca TaxID=2419777 RepID=A0A494XJB5_9BURK|nr:GNAT family N-acetyltransferase [Trinickia fusca]RKP48174.1 GNAT family N-acetyltransferase [Trinickia fusca]